MITLQEVTICKKEDYKGLLEHIKEPQYIDDDGIEALYELLGLRCNKIYVEFPYYDHEYLSTFYLYYAKKFESYPKECYRLHIWKDDDYFGFITLRPTVGTTKIGKSYLEPKLFQRDGYVMTHEYEAHVCGVTYKINAVPWMKQDTDITVCGHIAAWTAVRLSCDTLSHFSDVTMGDIIEKIPEEDHRMIPTSTIKVSQIVKLLSNLGYSPINNTRNSLLSDEDAFLFEKELYSYIESKIPVIMCSEAYKHSVTVIGHGKINYDKLDNEFKDKQVVYFGDLIDEFFVNDDAIIPYNRMGYKKKTNAFSLEREATVEDLPRYYTEDFDRMLVPLHNRMQYNFSSLVIRVDDYVDKHNYLLKGAQYVQRIYLVSAQRLKAEAYTSLELDQELKNIITQMSLPRYVWCVDYATFDEYKEKKTSMRIVADTTASNKSINPFLLIQSKEWTEFFDEGRWKKAEINVEPYAMFPKNLEEI